MIIIIDNYDSFTFNLVQYIGELGYCIKTLRNDKTCLQEIQDLNPTHIIISPGPGRPQEAGITIEAILYFTPKIPILGVCLGHQSIGYAYDSSVKKLNRPMHGKISKIYHDQQGIFRDVPNPFNAARYHSLIIDRQNLSNLLKVTAETKEGIIMACKHIKYPHIQGVQFHPESLWTEYGKKLYKIFYYLNLDRRLYSLDAITISFSKASKALFVFPLK